MTGERTEEAGNAGLLFVAMGGQRMVVPVLKMKQSREWKEHLGTLVSTVDLGDLSDIGQTLSALANTPIDVVLALVLDYDRTDALGGQDWIEENATDREVYVAFEQMVTATYPFGSVVRSVAEAFGPQLRAVTAMAIGQAANALSQASSGNGLSRIGDSTPTPSPSDSPTNNSSSSGPMASAGSTVRPKSASS